MIRRLFGNTLFRDTATLVTGTIGGRIILLLALPFVTRLYGPDDFKLLAVFTALVSTVSVAACLRLEIAIPLAENDDDAANLLAMALMSAAVASLIFVVICAVAPMSFAAWLGVEEIFPYLWLVAAGIFLTASYTALQFWATRHRRFGAIARTRVTQASAGAATMLGMGWLGFAPVGLLLGNMLTLGAGGLSLVAQAWRDDQHKLRVISFANMGQALRHYRRYPVFSTLEALANVASVQVPILIIAANSGSEAGQLFLAMQVMAMPMTLLGASVGQIYASRAADEFRNGTLHRFTVTMMKRLFLIGIGPLAFAALLGPMLFPVFFGAEWHRAGVIVAWIAPWMLLQLVVSPVSMGLHIVRAQAAAMGLQCLGLILRVSAVLVGPLPWAAGLIEMYALSGAIFYALYGWMIILAVRKA